MRLEEGMSHALLISEGVAAPFALVSSLPVRRRGRHSSQLMSSTRISAIPWKTAALFSPTSSQLLKIQT